MVPRLAASASTGTLSENANPQAPAQPGPTELEETLEVGPLICVLKGSPGDFKV